MKKTLEALLVVAALALGVFVVREGSRRAGELAAHPFVGNPASGPGADAEDPRRAASSPERGGVAGACPWSSCRGPRETVPARRCRPAAPSRRAVSPARRPRIRAGIFRA